MQYYEGLNYKHLYPVDQAQYNREFTRYHIKKDYKEVGLKAFESVTEIGENFQCGKSDNYYFVIKPDGKLIDRVFSYVGKFREGNCIVMYEQPCSKHPYIETCGNHIDTNGQLVFGHHQFVYIGNFVNGIANVCLAGGIKNYINKRGWILFPQFPDLTNTFEFSCGWGCIQREYKEYNYINAEGKLLLTEWVDRAWDFVDNKARVIINGTEQVIEINN